MSIQKIVAMLLAIVLSLCSASALAVPEGYEKAGGTQNCFLYQGYTVEYCYDFDKFYEKDMKTRIDSYNDNLSGDDLDVYFYFVNCARSMDFTVDYEPGMNPIYLRLKDLLGCADHTACLDITTFDEFKDMFYENDHHWNHVGAQKGYEDIIKLLFDGQETPYQPVREITFDTIYNGSLAKRTGLRNATKPFAAYEYDLPEIVPYVNGKRKVLDRQAQYLAGKYPKDALATHFANYYGGDIGELVMDANQPDKENLLVLCNSFANPLRRLLPAHFNKTYFVDLRYYGEGKKDQVFHTARYIREHNISKVLILGDISLFIYGKRLAK